MAPKIRQKFTFKKFLPSRLFLIAGVAVLILFSVGLGKEIIRRWEVNQEINQLKKEVESLEKRNVELADLIQYFNTEGFKEKEARTKLGLAKPGEKVVVIPNIEKENLKNNNSEEQAASLAEMSNPKKWWRYFFVQ